MKKRLLVFLLSFSLLSGTITCVAADTTNNEPAESGVVNFTSNISYYSQDLTNIISDLSDNLTQVIFTIDAGLDVFTIGYVVGDLFSSDDMDEKVQEMVSDLNEMILTEPRLSSNRNIGAADLQLESLSVEMPLESLKEYANKNSEIAEIRTAPEVTTINNMGLSNRAVSNAINGSYHTIQNMGIYNIIHWYNQTNGTDTICRDNAASPHLGDGNNRYRSGAGYKWFPNNVDVSFITGIRAGQNRTQLWYKYTQAQLNNLILDSNEALEMEVLFYNYANASTSNKGTAYQYHLSNESTAWATNQPNAYLDTTFMDDSNAVSFCIGVDRAENLNPNSWYFWSIDGRSGTQNGYANDGRFKVTAQRGYRNNVPSGAWSVFAEEHEPILSLGLTSSQNWVPVTQSAWMLSSNNSTWNFISGSSPVKG